MRVLVTYGTKQQSTAEIATWVGEALEERGHQVDVRDAKEDPPPQGYDAVIVGGALYTRRWVRAARRYVRRHDAELRAKPVWFFSSGPLDESASRTEPRPVWGVRRLARRVGAVEHKTFGGRLRPERGSPFPVGDWRHPEEIKAWAAHVASELDEECARPRPAVHAPPHLPLVVLCLFAGVSALFGGASLVAAPDGSLIQLPLRLLQPTSFADFFIPGLLLFGVGVLHFAVGLVALRPGRRLWWLALAAGLSMVGWTVSEMVLLRTVYWAQVLYLVVGLATSGFALRHRARVLRAEV